VIDEDQSEASRQSDRIARPYKHESHSDDDRGAGRPAPHGRVGEEGHP
jgi:hypothetical protein